MPIKIGKYDNRCEFQSKAPAQSLARITVIFEKLLIIDRDNINSSWDCFTPRTGSTWAEMNRSFIRVGWVK